MIILLKNNECIYLVFCERIEICNKVKGGVYNNLNVYSYIKSL